LPDQNKRQVETAPTANFAVSKDVFEAIGGLDPAHLASADSSFCYVLADKGIPIQFVNSFAVDHIHHATFKSLRRERFNRGKEFGMMRTSLKTWTKAKSVLFVLSIPFLPGKNFIWKWMTVSKSGYFVPYLKAFFAHLILEHAWMYGQFVSHVRHLSGNTRY